MAVVPSASRGDVRPSSDLAPPFVLEAHDVHKRFGATEVLKGISMRVEAKEVVCILGPSGSGKSTFLRCINRLEHPDQGQILVNGQPVGYRRSGNKLYELSRGDVAAQRAKIGMVFQHFNLFPHMTVLGNLLVGPVRVLGRPKDEARMLAESLLRQVGLSEKASMYPSSLSGGQQQRVAIARALAMGPELLLFDEPTSALDPQLVGEVLAVMRDVADMGTTMIVVTHEIGFAREVADSVCVLDEGRIVESGPPGKVLSDPESARTRSFLQRIL